jgi:hypothetical protein
MDDIQKEIEKLARKVTAHSFCILCQRRLSVLFFHQVARDLGVEFEKKLKYEQNSQYGHFLRLSRTVIPRLFKYKQSADFKSLGRWTYSRKTRVH